MHWILFSYTIDLPKSVKCLEFIKYDIHQNIHFDFDKLLAQQAKVLTYLKVHRIGTFNRIDTQYPFLTHLTTDVFQNFESSITHLYLFIHKENKNMKINLEQFSHCLTHLTLHFVEEIVVSFQSLEQCLFSLHQLTHLTVQASDKNDLFDDIIYPSSNFAPIITVPSNMEKYLFYENKIDSLLIDIDRLIISPIHRFTQVKSLILCGSTLMSLDVLKTIMDFNQIEKFDFFLIESLSTHELNILIKHCPRLNFLIMDYNSLFVRLSQIHTLRLDVDFLSLSIDNLWHTVQNVKALEISVNSKDMMLDIVDQFDDIDNFLFSCDEFSEDEYLEVFIEKLYLHWLEDNSYRLAMNHFTYRQGEEYQQIRMSIDDSKTKKYSDITH
ncbi:unnamed protein product [Rotaria sp. Silwood1]|nr:unnamed protein product [Rotaria sp. Silwood1]